ncbi:uncharacterized protein LOC131625667 [Vicia villosa]|uniref:uncharacterized protein LOC131625667 n=1 Tax=Vicia villosa TaxID=3911 RepID=UPI00273B17B8|nr:uncharacterized protein LOC131625667 [Vicia villosa]
MATTPFVYLGVPIFIGRPKPVHFLFVTVGKASLLTMAGRLLLVKFVIQSMLVHYISIYHWPGSLTKQVTTWMHNFIWSGNLEQKKVVNVAWKNCCKSLKNGGLGLRSLEGFNEGTKLHLCWQFVKSGKSWTTLLAERVLRNRRAISYHISSTMWTSIKECYQKVLSYHISSTMWTSSSGDDANI